MIGLKKKTIYYLDHSKLEQEYLWSLLILSSRNIAICHVKLNEILPVMSWPTVVDLRFSLRKFANNNLKVNFEPPKSLSQLLILYSFTGLIQSSSMNKFLSSLIRLNS